MLYSVIAEYLAQKGQKRWDNVSSNQTNRLTTSAEQLMAQRESWSKMYKLFEITETTLDFI